MIKPDKPVYAFVLMPFQDEFEDVYRIGIREAAEKVGITAERLDDQLYAEGMLDRIYRQIEAADLIIADMSGRNPNVFYEVGYAHAKQKLCVLITDDADSIPFDLLHRRHIVYGESISFLRDELTRHLRWALAEIETTRRSQIRAEMTVSGELEKTEYRAQAEIEMRIDLYNDADQASPEIHGVYFYTGSDWDIVQDNVACPRSNADVPPFKHRYQIRASVQRLAPKSWAQIKLDGKRVLASKWKGEEIKDEYTLTGTTQLRILTGGGNFDYELPINVTVEWLPF